MVQESSLCPPLQDPSTAKQRLQGLKTVDWSKKNKDWEGVCIVANSVVSNRQARFATKVYLKRHLGLVLSDAERRSLPTHLLVEVVA
ncbi:MAG TPA: DNA sulfur modification protein DndB [Gemmatimonadales bacterium]|nr:DNA sulfur modification protein DndB [Gemmatimonadales bacterium]